MSFPIRLATAGLFSVVLLSAQNNNSFTPRWWAKYQYLLQNGASKAAGPTRSATTVGANVDVSNECGPQSETFITLNTQNANSVAGGSNEIFRLPMRGYSSSDGGNSWAGADLPLPPAIGGGIDFGSDPSLAFDTRGNLFYSYIVVFFGQGKGINGTELAVARSTDGGQTFPSANFFSFSGGKDHFNDKPMITADTNLGSPFRDNVYLAWDAASGGSTSAGIRFARSTDHGASFSIQRIDNPSGPGRSIAAIPFVGPNGEVYTAWNDIAANTIAFNRSLDGGATFGTPGVVAAKTIPFDIGIPAISFRRALIYPTCDADRSSGHHSGRLYCAWTDFAANGVNTDIFSAFSDDRGATWSARRSVTDNLSASVDRFYPWLSVDAVTGEVNISFYDTRNDSTGSRFMTDVFFTRSSDGTNWLSPNARVSTASSNEHDCNGLFPCNAIDYGNQYGDYEGLVSFNGISHAIWTDSRNQQNFASGCRTNLAMEEVFTATIR
ncbi:MAG TPA: sialidase family protein [Bryobacteraceae bacterium]|nr:sialidase family protein [Bryobacteraceae bacterium]